MTDKYDLEVARLLGADKVTIREAWYRATPLFEFCGPRSNFFCGCPVSIKGSSYRAATEELTTYVRGREKIPDTLEAIHKTVPGSQERLEMLNEFAIVQRHVDLVLGR